MRPPSFLSGPPCGPASSAVLDRRDNKSGECKVYMNRRPERPGTEIPQRARLPDFRPAD